MYKGKFIGDGPVVYVYRGEWEDEEFTLYHGDSVFILAKVYDPSYEDGQTFIVIKEDLSGNIAPERFHPFKIATNLVKVDQEFNSIPTLDCDSYNNEDYN